MVRLMPGSEALFFLRSGLDCGPLTPTPHVVCRALPIVHVLADQIADRNVSDLGVTGVARSGWSRDTDAVLYLETGNQRHGCFVEKVSSPARSEAFRGTYPCRLLSCLTWIVCVTQMTKEMFISPPNPEECILQPTRARLREKSAALDDGCVTQRHCCHVNTTSYRVSTQEPKILLDGRQRIIGRALFNRPCRLHKHGDNPPIFQSYPQYFTAETETVGVAQQQPVCREYSKPT
jgi:hypothetical protein